MKTIFWLKFTKSEINHINSLIKMNEEEGGYTPPKNQYWSRSARIRKKLDDISKTCYMFQKPTPKLIDEIKSYKYKIRDKTR